MPKRLTEENFIFIGQNIYHLYFPAQHVMVIQHDLPYQKYMTCYFRQTQLTKYLTNKQ